MRDPHEIAADIRQLEFWDYNLCAELCMAADMQDEWNEASPGEVEKVVSVAAEKLGVQI